MDLKGEESISLPGGEVKRRGVVKEMRVLHEYEEICDVFENPADFYRELKIMEDSDEVNSYYDEREGGLVRIVRLVTA